MFKKMFDKCGTLLGGLVSGIQFAKGNIVEGIILLSFVFICDLLISYLEEKTNND